MLNITEQHIYQFANGYETFINIFVDNIRLTFNQDCCNYGLKKLTRHYA